MSSGPNLFTRLHKWAIRQDENFLTESLAIVLEHLLILAPETGVRLISRLTGGFLELAPDEATAVVLRTQVEAGSGRPDLEIRIPHRLVWIEVKAESELRTGQLEGYRVLLGESGAEQTQLVLLSRYAEVFQTEEARPDLALRWFELADWMETKLPVIEGASAIAGFVTRQFLDFLRGRNMNLTQVGKYMPEGVRALSNLLNMLFEAAAACKVSATKAASWNYYGINLDGKKYWLGLRLNDPENLWFHTRSRINPAAVGPLGIGELVGENWGPSWWRGADLESEAIHFFSRSKVSQMEWLENFLRECLHMARSIEVADQPPIPEEPEES